MIFDGTPPIDTPNNEDVKQPGLHKMFRPHLRELETKRRELISMRPTTRDSLPRPMPRRGCLLAIRMARFLSFRLARLISRRRLDKSAADPDSPERRNRSLGDKRRLMISKTIPCFTPGERSVGARQSRRRFLANCAAIGGVPLACGSGWLLRSSDTVIVRGWILRSSDLERNR
jgi:hypothetical protein